MEARRDIQSRIGGPPPKRFLIFPRGKFVATQFGDQGPIRRTFTYNGNSAKSVMEWFHGRGLDLPIDYNHKSLDPAADPIAAGRLALDSQPDGLYAVVKYWTPLATQRLTDGELFHFSPVFGFDKDLNVLYVRSLALVLEPAMDNQVPLMAASAIPYAAHPVVDIPWDGEKARAALKKWATGPDGKVNMKKFGEGFAGVRGDPNKFGSYILPHHTVVNGKLVTVKKGVEAAIGAIDGARGGLEGVSASDRAAMKKHLLSHQKTWAHETKHTAALSGGAENTMDEMPMYAYPELPTDAPEHMKAHHAAMKAHHAAMAAMHGAMTACTAKMTALADGLAAKVQTGNQTDTVIDNGTTLASPTAPNDLEAHLSAAITPFLTISGKSSVPEALGVLSAHKQSHEQIASLTAELNTLRAEKAKNEKSSGEAALSAQVERAIAEKKVVRSNQKAVDNLNAFGKAMGLVALTAFVDNMNVLGFAANPHEEVITQAGEISLTAEDKKAADQMGLTHTAVLTAKYRRAGREVPKNLTVN